MEEVEVVIVGAGLAGIYCARKLQHSGLNNNKNIKILEARNRVGGRCRTIGEEEGSCEEAVGTDVGGSYVGVHQKMVLSLINYLDLKVKRVNVEGNSILYCKGKAYTFAEGSNPYSLPLLSLLDSNNLLVQTHLLSSSKEILTKYELDYISVEDWLNKKAWTQVGKNLYKMMIRIMNCVEPNQISMYSWLCSLYHSGGLYRAMGSGDGTAQEYKVVGGTQQLTEKLLKKIQEEQKDQESVIRYECEVNEIEIRQDEKRVIVKSKNGMKFNCKYVILAIPPLCIREQINIHYSTRTNIGTDNSSPSLSVVSKQNDLDQYLKQFRMGRVIKTFVFYQHPWWRDQGFSGCIGVATATDDQDSTSELWPIVVSFDDSDDTLQKYTLLGFIVGEVACNKWQQKTKQQRQASIVNQYNTAFQGKGQVIGYEEVDWSIEKHSLGGYSACSVLGASAGITNNNLYSSSRSGNSLLWLAGTDYIDTHNGYMEGAIRSGSQVAEKVGRLLGLNQIRDFCPPHNVSRKFGVEQVTGIKIGSLLVDPAPSWIERWLIPSVPQTLFLFVLLVLVFVIVILKLINVFLL